MLLPSQRGRSTSQTFGHFLIELNEKMCPNVWTGTVYLYIDIYNFVKILSRSNQHPLDAKVNRNNFFINIDLIKLQVDVS